MDALPGGTYPTNSRGEYYGDASVKYYLQIEPDLILTTGTEGETGYIWWEDEYIRFSALEDFDRVQWTDQGYLIPLYNAEHEQIGWKEETMSVSYHDAPNIALNQNTVEAIKAQIAAAAQNQATEQAAAAQPVRADYMTIGGQNYETYVDNRGVVRLKDSVGNVSALELQDTVLVAATLKNGTYPRNSRGETYGHLELADYVGEQPDLIYSTGYSDSYEWISGYVWWEDYYSGQSEMALYDAEHRYIGTRYSGGGNLDEKSDQIYELEYQAKHSDSAGASDMVVTGTLNGVTYEIQPTNHGVVMPLVSYEELGEVERAMLKQMPEGYPQNSRGEYYGELGLEGYFQVSLDLIAATGTDGQKGYVWWEDEELDFDCVADLDQVTWNAEGYLIPLYDSEHNRIGWCQKKRTVSFDGVVFTLNADTVQTLLAGNIPQV